MFVNAPVATNHAVPFGVESKAEAMASMNGSVEWVVVGVGRRDVPSNPVAPWIAGAWTAGRVSPFAEPG